MKIQVIWALVTGALAVTASSPDTPGTPDLIARFGAKMCSRGPAFWCQNYQTSRLCRATKHCLYREWVGQADSYDVTDNTCDWCNTMVHRVKARLEGNQTEVST